MTRMFSPLYPNAPDASKEGFAQPHATSPPLPRSTHIRSLSVCVFDRVATYRSAANANIHQLIELRLALAAAPHDDVLTSLL